MYVKGNNFHNINLSLISICKYFFFYLTYIAYILIFVSINQKFTNLLLANSLPFSSQLSALVFVESMRENGFCVL